MREVRRIIGAIMRPPEEESPAQTPKQKQRISRMYRTHGDTSNMGCIPRKTGQNRARVSKIEQNEQRLSI
ncbi:MAG: hypothetical protein Q6363_002575 [Candidatus Njordarchaeota archaeon]